MPKEGAEGMTFGFGGGIATTLILLLAYALCCASAVAPDLPFEGEAERRMREGPVHFRDG